MVSAAVFYVQVGLASYIIHVVANILPRFRSILPVDKVSEGMIEERKKEDPYIERCLVFDSDPQIMLISCDYQKQLHK